MRRLQVLCHKEPPYELAQPMRGFSHFASVSKSIFQNRELWTPDCMVVFAGRNMRTGRADISSGTPVDKGVLEQRVIRGCEMTPLGRGDLPAKL